MKKTYNQILKENRELRSYLREIRDFPEFGEHDCGLRIECPVINCQTCLATQALKRKRPPLDRWRRI